MTFNQCHVKTRIGNLAVLCYCSKLVELALDHIFKTSATTKEKARDLSSLLSVFALLLQIGSQTSVHRGMFPQQFNIFNI